MPQITSQEITFKDNSEELKFILIELDQLILEYKKTDSAYIEKIKNGTSTDPDPEFKKLQEITNIINILVDKAESMQNSMQPNLSLFNNIKTAIADPYDDLQDQRINLNNITDQVKDLVKKNKDGKLNNKSVTAKYLITTLFVIIIIFLAIRSFIYSETNNIDIIILISIIFLIIYQFI